MELAFAIQKIPGFRLMIIIHLLPRVSGLNIVDTNVTSCDGTAANITFSVDLQSGSIAPNTEIWYYEATTIATASNGSFSPIGNYRSRLHSYSSYGLTLDDVTDADKGRYKFEFYSLSAIQGTYTATTTLIVKVTPSENCVPSYRQDGASTICELDSSANCGSPRLVPIWTNTSGNSLTVINPGKYTCCATGSILTDCCRGNSSFCRTFDVAVLTTPDPTKTMTCCYNVGAIIGGVIGSVLGVCIVVSIWIFLHIKRNDIQNYTEFAASIKLPTSKCCRRMNMNCND